MLHEEATHADIELTFGRSSMAPCCVNFWRATLSQRRALCLVQTTLEETKVIRRVHFDSIPVMIFWSKTDTQVRIMMSSASFLARTLKFTQIYDKACYSDGNVFERGKCFRNLRGQQVSVSEHRIIQMLQSSRYASLSVHSFPHQNR